MKENTLSIPIRELSDNAVFEEAAKRLQKQYLREHSTEFAYGTFRFIFHDGRFQGVEDWPRNKRYVSPKRNPGENG
ncbi:MAG: hypothetical protein AB7O96_03565 [Pseudobdellovibrionaceae bacterium]